MAEHTPGPWAIRKAHDPRTLEIFRAIECIDLTEFDDYFCWKSGGDGDNGEVLMNELDLYFQRKDANEPAIAKAEGRK